jgi:uncharacterized protein YecT (DUF1311 family)
MTMCAWEEAERTDAEMDRMYRDLLSRAAALPEAPPKIEATQAAWITYKDAYLEALFPADNKQAQYGTIYGMKLNLARAEVTRRQIVALRDLLRQWPRSAVQKR